jgi:hypothetical protein
MLHDFERTHHLPPDAVRGGAHTMYPEYGARLGAGSSSR